MTFSNFSEALIGVNFVLLVAIFFILVISCFMQHLNCVEEQQRPENLPIEPIRRSQSDVYIRRT